VSKTFWIAAALTLGITSCSSTSQPETAQRTVQVQRQDLKTAAVDALSTPGLHVVTHQGRESAYEVVGDQVMVGGDMILGSVTELRASLREVQALLQKSPTQLSAQGFAAPWTTRTVSFWKVVYLPVGGWQYQWTTESISSSWPQWISYSFDASVTEAERQAIRGHLARNWNPYTTLDALEDPYWPHRVVIRMKALPGGIGGQSAVGRQGGVQYLDLNSDHRTTFNWLQNMNSTLIHEMAHAAGLNHEHNRCDRDEHWELYDWAKNDYWSNLKICQAYTAMTPFDYSSVTLYSGIGRPVFKNSYWMGNPNNPGQISELPSNVRLSTGDVQMIETANGRKP